MRAAAAALAIVLVVGGCAGSPRARFYVLDPVAGAGTGPGHGAGAIVVGRVRIPDYLDRPQLVRHKTRDRLAVSETERWGGALAAMIRRVLSEDLARRLPGRVVPAAEAGSQNAESGQVVRVRIFDFSAWPSSRQVKLVAAWSLLDAATGKATLRRRETISVSVSGGNTRSQVNGMSRALGVLADHIAAAL